MRLTKRQWQYIVIVSSVIVIFLMEPFMKIFIIVRLFKLIMTTIYNLRTNGIPFAYILPESFHPKTRHQNNMLYKILMLVNNGNFVIVSKLHAIYMK